MTCGEALEFQYANQLDVTEEQYEQMVRSKTGSLMGAATEIGAGLNGGAKDVARRERYRRFGEVVGVAFQIVDDLFDYLGDAEVTGKPVGYDLAEGKVTLPLIAALRNATDRDRARLKRLAQRKRWSAAQWGQLKAMIEKCGGFAYARDRARALADEARGIPEQETPGEARGRARRAKAGSTRVDGAERGVRAARRALERAVDYAVQREW
jgi:octaprenyl-diphosphate synthase